MGTSSLSAYEQPLEVDAHDGEVVIVGPGAAAIALTPGAAAVSAGRLAAAAKRAVAMIQDASSSHDGSAED
jgi:hypothetical protein